MRESRTYGSVRGACDETHVPTATPTRGIDVGARADIYRIMRELCSLGYVLIMTSSDLEEVVGIADIVVTMYRGRTVARYERQSIAMARILADITHPVRAAA
jgi:ABC-type sugar transport system ATPase subunit